MRQIILDTETTGLEPSQGHRVIEIGCVELINRVPSGNNLHIYLNPDRDSDLEALNVHGLTTEFLSDKPRFNEVAERLLAYIEGAELIIHNASFDLKFLDAELARVGRGSVTAVCSVTDSLTHARTLHPGKRNSLDALCDRYGISNAHRILHGALLDSQLLAEVWLAMTRGQEGLLIDLDSEDNGTGADGLIVARLDTSGLKVMRASEEEQAAHEAYLSDLDKASGAPALWRRLDVVTPAEPARV